MNRAMQLPAILHHGFLLPLVAAMGLGSGVSLARAEDDFERAKKVIVAEKAASGQDHFLRLAFPETLAPEPVFPLEDCRRGVQPELYSKANEPDRFLRVVATGQFAPGDNLLTSPVENAWISVREISFEGACVWVGYSRHNGWQPGPKIAVLLRVATKDGVWHTC